MELAKQDRKHINDDVSRLAFRINIESREYALLYEKEYLRALIARLQDRLDNIDQYAECSMRASQPQTKKKSK